MNPNDDLGEQAADLAAAVQELGEKVGITSALARRTSSVESLAKKNRRWVQITVAGLLLDLSLTILGVFLFRQVDSNASKIEVTQAQVRDNACKTNGLFIANYKPTDLPAGTTLAVYNRNFSVFFDSYRDLGCLPKLADGVGPP